MILYLGSDAKLLNFLNLTYPQNYIHKDISHLDQSSDKLSEIYTLIIVDARSEDRVTSLVDYADILNNYSLITIVDLHNQKILQRLNQEFINPNFYFLPLDLELLKSKIDFYRSRFAEGIKESPLYISGIEDVFQLNPRSPKNLEENYLDHIGTFIMILDPNKIVRYINKKGLSILKCQREDVVGKNFVENFIPKNFKKDVSAVAKSLVNDEINNISYYINPIVTAEGEERIISWTNTTLENSSKESVAFLTSGEDITEQVESEEQLKLAQQRQKALFESLPQYIFIKDTKLHYYAVNQTLADLFHTSIEGAIGKSDEDFFPLEAVEEFRRADKKVLEKGEVLLFEESINKDGEIRLLETMKRPIYDDEGNITGLLGIATDITDKKKAEQHSLYQSRLAQMGEMLSIIAHQWRQPLSAIGATVANVMVKNQLQILDNEKLFEEMSKIDNQLKYLSRTIDDFRNFFKPDQEKQITSIPQIIEKTLQIIGGTLSLHGVEVSLEKCSNDEILMFENELVQVFLNFFNNSLDIFVERETKAAIITVSCEPEGDLLDIKVADNGGGAEREVLAHLWDPYYSTKLEKHGTGLGLYMVKQVIEEHCLGHIEAYNGEEGLVFSIKLPRQKS